jgi:antitoxin component YwqK of YwqJK toxin-antitoxin module
VALNKFKNMNSIKVLVKVKGELLTYDNGVQKNIRTGEIYETKDGKKHGEFKWINSAGQLLEHCYYHEGIKHGLSKTYFSNGQLEIITTYTYGNRDGRYRRYYSTGSPCEYSQYIDGKLDGFYICWATTGEIHVLSYHENGVLKKQFVNGGLIVSML